MGSSLPTAELSGVCQCVSKSRRWRCGKTPLGEDELLPRNATHSLATVEGTKCQPPTCQPNEQDQLTLSSSGATRVNVWRL